MYYCLRAPSISLRHGIQYRVATSVVVKQPLQHGKTKFLLRLSDSMLITSFVNSGNWANICWATQQKYYRIPSPIDTLVRQNLLCSEYRKLAIRKKFQKHGEFLLMFNL